MFEKAPPVDSRKHIVDTFLKKERSRKKVTLKFFSEMSRGRSLNRVRTMDADLNDMNDQQQQL